MTRATAQTERRKRIICFLLGRLLASDSSKESFAITLVERNTATTPGPNRRGPIRPATVQAGGSVDCDGGRVNAILRGQPHGAVRSSFGVDFGLATVSVLTYRAFAFWLPTLPGAVAYLQLRRTVAAWREEHRGHKAILSEA